MTLAPTPTRCGRYPAAVTAAAVPPMRASARLRRSGDAAASGTTNRMGNSFTSVASPTSAPARTSRLVRSPATPHPGDVPPTRLGPVPNRNTLRKVTGNDP